MCNGDRVEWLAWADASTLNDKIRIRGMRNQRMAAVIMMAVIIYCVPFCGAVETVFGRGFIEELIDNSVINKIEERTQAIFTALVANQERITLSSALFHQFDINEIITEEYGMSDQVLRDPLLPSGERMTLLYNVIRIVGVGGDRKKDRSIVLVYVSPELNIGKKSTAKCRALYQYYTDGTSEWKVLEVP